MIDDPQAIVEDICLFETTVSPWSIDELIDQNSFFDFGDRWDIQYGNRFQK